MKFWNKTLRSMDEYIPGEQPANIEEYIKAGGYIGLQNALEASQDAVIRQVEISGIRGRGGGGFPTGKKWRSCLEVSSDMKYMLCNGDEGDPGGTAAPGFNSENFSRRRDSTSLTAFSAAVER